MLSAFVAYPAENASFDESWCGGGIGDPPLSSDGVFDKNKLPPISETNVMGELFFSNVCDLCEKNGGKRDKDAREEGRNFRTFFKIFE